MRDFATSAIAVVGVFGVMALALLAIGFYAVAFEVGAEEWFGWEGWWVPAIFLAVVFFLRGGIFLAAGMIVGGYGAYYVWDWPLWAVVPVFFPGIAFMIGGLLVAAIGSTFEKARG